MTTRYAWPRIAATSLAIALAGCSGSSDKQPATTPAKPPDQAAAKKPDPGGIGAPNIPWKDKTRPQRLDYMGIYVLDTMGKLFAEWKPDEYGPKGAWRCQRCHGEGFDSPGVDFHMPRVAWKLDPVDPVGDAMQYKADAATFMVEKVVPTMAKLLGEEPMKADGTGGTFGCFRCHPKRGEKAP